MALNRNLTMASSIALAVSLSACGGGGGGSGGIASIPPPPVTPMPTPTPTPTPGATSIGAPARASIGNGGSMPGAIAGGPDLHAHPITIFPLLQSVVTINSAGLLADTSTTNAGGTLAFDSAREEVVLNLNNSAVGISHVALPEQDWGPLHYTGTSGSKDITVEMAKPATTNLSWTSYGTWNATTLADNSHSEAAFVTGYQTPIGAMPTSGMAGYAGTVSGQLIVTRAGSPNGVASLALSGDGVIAAHFDSGNVVGSFSNMFVTGDSGRLPWNSVYLSGVISGVNMFGGTTFAASAPGNAGSLGASATGSFAGTFFGPHADELGAVWSLSDGSGAAFGTFGAKKDPGCPGCWDY